jgi:hypothetical protein
VPKQSEGEIILAPKRRPVHDNTDKPPYIVKPKGRGANGGTKNGKRGESYATHGRPPAEIDEKTIKLIRDLAAVGCPVREISYVTKIPVATLNRRWLHYVEEGRMNANVSIRKKQFTKAIAGDNTMLIWYGKQHLGQTDKQQVSGDPENPIAPTQIIVEFVD